MRGAILGLAIPAGTASAAVPNGTIDLGEPGALDRIEAQSPERHATIVKILRFELEGTEYVINVVLSGPQGTLQPAR